MSTETIISITAASVCAICALVMMIVALANKKTKTEVSYSFEPASKVEFEKHVEINRLDHEGIHRKIGGVERGAQANLHTAIKEGNDSREALHKRINELLAAICKLEGKLEAGNDK